MQRVGRRPGRGRGDRAATIIEAAFVTPLFFALLFGVIEWGGAFFDRLTVANMSVSGAREGSVSGADSDADYHIVQAVKQASAGVSPSKITMVVVYRATGPADRVPEACKSASVTDTSGTRGCNRYVGADFSLAEDQFGCHGPPGPADKKDRFWCPEDRKIAFEGANIADHIGVYVEAEHDNYTGFFGSGYTFRSDTVYRIEPRVKE